ncbi:unnamed protein product, partial [Rotaria magnacalcarata]
MGSSHSWLALRTKTHSLCFNVGLPSLFTTINPVDMHSSVALYFPGVDLDLDKILPEALETSYERVKTIATHPVASAKFFNCLIISIFKSLVLGGVLGPKKAYFGTVESQGRGSLHLHLLIWLNHDFTPIQLKQQIQNEDFRQKLLKYLEDIFQVGHICSDAKAIVYYITDYVTESSLAFYDMFTLAQQGIKSIEQQQVTYGTESAVEKSRKLVLRCYNTIASH